MLIEIVSALIGGLGLAVYGMRQVQTGLQHMAGRRLRGILRRVTDSGWRTGLTGIAIGAVTQSSNAAGYIVLSLVASGLVSARRGFLVAAWAAPGTAAIVLIATVRLELAVLYLVGLAGILQVSRLRESPRWGAAITVAFGVGLLFLGLQILRGALSPAGEPAWLAPLLEAADGAQLLLLLVGAAVALVAQSASTVAAAIVALAGAAWFGLPALLALVAGACLGSSLSSVIMGWRLSGIGRQILMFQAISKMITVVLVVGLGALEMAGGASETSFEAALGSLSRHPGTQAGISFAVIQLLSAVVGTLLQHPLGSFCARLWPADAADALSTPRYLYEQALADPATALDLVEREQARLVAALPGLLDRIRSEGGDGAPAMARGAQTLATTIDRFLADLLARQPEAREIQRAIRLKSRNDVAAAQVATLEGMTHAVARLGPDPRLATLVDAMVESLHLLLTTAAEAANDPNPADIDLLRDLSGDRGEIVERVRQQAIREHRDLPSGAQDDLFLATGMFERSVWLIGRFAGLFDAREELAA